MTQKSLFIICFIVLIGGGPSAYAGDFAYLTSYTLIRTPKLIQVDTTNEAIIKKIDMPNEESLGNMVIDEKGGCFLSSFRLAERYGRNIFYYDAASGKLDQFMHLDSIFGPKITALNGNELIVGVEGNDLTKSKSGILFIDRGSKNISQKIFFREDDPKYSSCKIIDSYYDGRKYLYATTMDFVEEEYPGQYIGERYGFGSIVVVDVTSKEMFKTIEVPREYDTLSGVVGVGNKIYVAAQLKGIPTFTSERKLNKELLVFSLDKGTLESTIKISPHPFELVFDKISNKLYVLHIDDDKSRNNIEVIDVKKDKIIGHLNIPSQTTASMVSSNKIYLSVGPGFMRDTRANPKIVVIDTKKDKIINEIDGLYQDISINPKY